VTKFVGKFRKNKNYNDDYSYDHKRHRDEHSEIKKMIAQAESSKREISEDIQIMLDEEDRK
jgi:hypothetical protein